MRELIAEMKINKQDDVQNVIKKIKLFQYENKFKQSLNNLLKNMF
jgi:tartrate dehydratase alpha subunit/fumarate hydratase class I-like protein